MGVVHPKRKVSTMTKLGIDLNPRKGWLICEDELSAITRGCVGALSKLGILAEVVEVIRVSWVEFPGETEEAPGPNFAIHFADMGVGSKVSHGTDFRFIGSGSVKPTANEIQEHLEKSLRRHIKEYLEMCTKATKQVQERLETLQQG